MTSILVSVFELGPPVWTLLHRYNDPIQMPRHELKPCGRCGNSTTARIAFARHLLKRMLLNWVCQCRRCSMCKKPSRCEITRPPSRKVSMGVPCHGCVGVRFKSDSNISHTVWAGGHRDSTTCGKCDVCIRVGVHTWCHGFGCIYGDLILRDWLHLTWGCC